MDAKTMERYAPVLAGLPLLAGIPEAERAGVLRRLGARTQRFPKGAFLLLAGDEARWMGVVLEGGAQVLREDYLGRRSILASLAPGDLFAETFVLAGAPAMPVSVEATAPCVALFLDYMPVLRGTQPADSRLLANLLGMTARKNMHLNERLSLLEKRTIRERLQAYLSIQAQRSGSRRFAIPFDRQQLADYLSVDRSALSAELSKMRAEGLLETDRSAFCLPEAPRGGFSGGS